MNCRVHMEREATSFCKDCNAPMCPECNSTFGSMCMNCVEKLCKNGKQEIIITLGISLLCLAIGIWHEIDKVKSGMSTDIVQVFFSCFFFFFLPFGWKAVGKIADSLLLAFARTGILGWIIFFVLKLLASLLIGWILGIPKMVEMIKDWKTYEKFGNRVHEMKMMPKSRAVNE